MEPTSVTACDACGEHRLDLKEMRVVTGQVEGPSQNLHVATCASCGWKGLV